MVWQVIKKQGLSFLRNPQHLLMLIALPILLITILSVALGGIMQGETPQIQAKIAVTIYDEERDIEDFLQSLDEIDLSKKERDVITLSSREVKVLSILMDEVFPSFRGQIEVERIEREEIEEIRRDSSYDTIIEIPENFTYDLLEHLYFNKGNPPNLQLIINEEKQLSSQIIKQILEDFNEQISLISFATKEGLDTKDLIQSNIEIESGSESRGGQDRTYTSKEYYTFAMGVMNVLFIASTIGSYAYRERRDHIFDRIIIADISKGKYFLGIYLSALVFAFIQLMIIFIAANLIFSVSVSNNVGLVTVSLALSSAVGGVAVLLSAISYRMDSEVLTNYFQSIIVSIFAFMGGSFFPLESFPMLFQRIGDLTPNGAGLSAYLLILQQPYELDSSVLFHVYYLIGFSFILLIIAVAIFPKRGQNS